MSGRSLEDAAAKQLVASGFLVVRGSLTRDRSSKANVEADLVAWTGDENSELVPELVVEVKASARRHSNAALAQLSQIAAVTGAPRAFLFDGHWREADPTFTRFQDAECPKPRLPLPRDLVSPILIERELWSIRDRLRGRGGAGTEKEFIDAVLAEAKSSDGTALSSLAQGRRARLAIARILSVGIQADETPATLASAMARLLSAASGWEVLDPVCRSGGLLWGVADRDRGLELRGWCSNPTQRAITRKLGDFADTEVEVECVSFGEILAKDAAVDAIISIFPFGVRLPDRYEIEGAASTNQFDTLLLDRVTRWLRPGGRAVIAVPPRLLFAEDSATAAVRARIAQALRIVAVIELPAGVFRGTNVPVGIVVLERSESGETLVARLRDDWELQLAPSGDFFRTYQQHLLRPSS